MSKSRPISRRTFIEQSATTAAILAAPLVLPRRLFGASAPSNRVRVGHIGAGRIAQSHDMVGVANADLADVLAVCDLDSRRAESGKRRVQALHAKYDRPKPDISVYHDYHELLARPDIDAVTISTPDHWHAQLAIAAVYAGKDVYLQKPMTMTHAEGVLLRSAVAKTGRILQVGSQQRSWGPNEQFRKAVEFVRSGRVGTLKRVEIGLPTDPTAPDDPQQPVPPNLDYNTWLGPDARRLLHGATGASAGARHGGQSRRQLTPGLAPQRGVLPRHDHGLGCASLRHGALGHEHRAHRARRASRDAVSFPTNKIWNVHGAYHIELTYPGGILMIGVGQVPQRDQVHW